MRRWLRSQSVWAVANAERYVPFQYTARGKRPGQRYLFHHVLLEDVALLVLALTWTMSRPVPGAAGLLLLHLSFWVIYEIGYHENDHLAVAREARPNVPAGSADYGPRMKPNLAWATALVLAVPGMLLLVGFNQDALRLLAGVRSAAVASVALLALWAAYLVASRAAFGVYNRTDVTRRGLLYVGLQLFRTLGYLVVLRASLVGAMALAALAIARWIPYLTYREVGVHWSSSYRPLLLVLFTVLAGAATAADAQAIDGPQLAAVLLWLVVLARRELRSLLVRRPARS